MNFIGLFTILNFYQVYIDKKEDPEPHEHATTEALRKQYHTLKAKRIE